MAKAKLTTRAISSTAVTSDNLAKGSQLTHNQLDSNFINLRDQTFGIAADDSSTIQVGAGDTLYIQGGSNVTTSTDSAGVVTINATGEVTASSTTTFTNKTFDANGTGNSLSNIEVADFAAASIVTEAEGISSNDNDTTIPTSAAVKDLVDTATANTGDITFVGSTMISPSNADITLDPAGTGKVSTPATLELTADTSTSPNLLISGGGSTGDFLLKLGNSPTRANQGNSIYADGTPLYLESSTNSVILQNSALTVAADRAINFETTTGGSGNGTIKNLNLDIINNKISSKQSNEDIELRPNGTGSVIIDDATLVGTPKVGDGTGNATLTSNGAHNLILNTNSGTNSGSIEIVDGATGQISVHTNGHGNISIGSNTGTGDGTGTTTVEGTQFKRFANSTSGEWMNIPMSADGSTSQDVIFQMNSGKPELYFNSAGSAASDIAKIRVGTGGLTIQTDGSNSSDANIRIQSAGTITLDAAGQINLGGGTIVVSGNKMFTDSSNEDFELLANGTGNISMLSQANMNSNKIINVTDPGAAQDAATKSYVDTQVSGVAAGQGFKVIGDDSAGVDIPEAGTLYIQGGTNVTTATDSAGVVTINAADNSLSLIDEDSFGTNSETRPPSQQSVKAYVDTQDAAIASDTLTFTNKTFDADGTGNNLSNIEVANLKSGVLDTDLSSVSGSDDTLASAKAIKAYVDSNSGASTGDITFVGSTMISPSNADITLNPAGTGKVNINAVYTLPNADGSANQVLGTNGSGVLSFRDPTAINIDGGVADSTYTSVPTIDGGTA